MASGSACADNSSKAEQHPPLQLAPRVAFERRTIEANVMGEHQASRSAIRVAVLRAAHQILDGEPKILADSIGIGLVPEASEAALRADSPRLERPTIRRLRANMVLRSRWAEDRLAVAVRAGVTQYIVLGAGLDTFAYRQPPWARRLTIIEADHPASQEFKIACVRSAGVSIPPNVRFLPVDFGSDAVGEKLTCARLDAAKPILVSWLGVTQYLARHAVETALFDIAAWRGGSEIALTCIAEDWWSLDAEERDVMEEAEARATQSGEPWLSKFSTTAMMDLLSTAGFSRIAPFTIENATRRYFHNRPDGLLPCRGVGLVSARTQKGMEF
jgi:methyltransferase (TIGR00027 family)